MLDVQINPAAVEGPSILFEFEDQRSLFVSEPRGRVAYVPQGHTVVRGSQLLVGVSLRGLECPAMRLEFGAPVVVKRGKRETSRLVYHYVRTEHGLPVRAGLTVHSKPGSWSSWPPHAFEMQAYTMPAGAWGDFLEMFVYFTDPPGGWAIQTTFEAQRDLRECVFVWDKSTFEIPLGAHPVVAAPGYRLAYIWVYRGGVDKLEDVAKTRS